MLPLQAGRLEGRLRRPRLHAPRQGGHDQGQEKRRGLRHNVAFHRSIGRFYRKYNAGRNPLLDVCVYFAIGVKLAVSAARSTIARREWGA